MSLPPLEIKRGDAYAIERYLADRIAEHNARIIGCNDAESYAITQKNAAGAEIIAGIAGFTWCGCCFVSQLWVSETLRGSGAGRDLINAVEAHARSKGCSIVILSTHSFQAPGFYERMGFEKGAVVPDYPVGYSDIFYSKRLVLAEN
jgi:N-acetylglutamate synthase-like GNAT family acetyltransferase